MRDVTHSFRSLINGLNVGMFHLFRHERYLGMWSDGVKSGPGMFVTSTGSYGEAIFSAGSIAVSLTFHTHTHTHTHTTQHTLTHTHKIVELKCLK